MNKSTMRMLLATTLCLTALLAQATALTKNTTIAQRTGDKVGMKVQSNEVLYVGALVAITSGGLAVNAADSVDSNQVVGINETWIDQTGALYQTNLLATLRTGIYRLSNGGSFTKAHIGQYCYVKDNATVTTSSDTTYAIPAGVIVDVDAAGVWVALGPQYRSTTGNFAALTVSGAGTVGGALDVTGAATVGDTLAVTGVATFTAEAVFNLGLDADFITVDAGAGIDNKTAGALMVGASTATSVEIADTGVATDIQGTLSVDQAAVFDSTVAASGFKIGAVDGMSGIKTNSGTGYTNLWYFSGGLLTNVSFTGTMP